MKKLTTPKSHSLAPIFLQRPCAGQAKRSRLRCALIQTFWLSFESTGKVIKPLSTRSFENMSRVASGARASCYTVSARALKFHTESRTNRTRQCRMLARVHAQPIHRTEQDYFVSDRN